MGILVKFPGSYYVKQRIKYHFRSRRGASTQKPTILFYCGLNRGASFDNLFPHFDICHAFEANPDLALRAKIKYAGLRHVHIIHGALGRSNGSANLFIANNRGESSSLGKFNLEWSRETNISASKTIRVPAINLHAYCIKNRITYITEYISDLQGMDLEVLKTLKPYLEAGTIGAIQCEVTQPNVDVYQDLPSNQEEEFERLLAGSYKKTGEFNVGKWEKDCRWELIRQ